MNAGVVEWLRTHDPGYGALRRAGRTALVMPAMFAVGDHVLKNPALATFAAFGSFAMLLLVDFAGPIRDRLLDQAALGLACALLIAIGTLCSRTTWLAVAAMAAIAFAVLFASVVSSVLAGATTALLLAFILPVSLPGSASAIPDRVMGWGLAAAVSLPAIALLWPAPAHNPVRTAASAAARAIAKRLRAEIAYLQGDGEGDTGAARSAAIAEADQAVAEMQRLFFATPYRPGGLSTDARAIVRIVDEMRWLSATIARARPAGAPRPVPTAATVKRAAADVLECAADRIDLLTGSRAALGDAVTSMRSALRDLERETMSMSMDGTGADGHSPQTIVSALDPSFRAQEISFVAARIAGDAEVAAKASERSWADRLRGRRPAPEVARPLTAARERAGAHLARSSHSLQNSIRGAVALALSVLVTELTSAQHGFWVAFGTLAVLRSNALSTGQNFVRALVGTAIGFGIGGLLVYLVGTHTAVLWALLPIAVLFAGLAPSAISFAAGQAAFTLTLLILFNLIAPAGWQIGLVRIEDVAIGGAVSLVVGLLFWPRGAAAGLSRALADAYRATSQYLDRAVEYGVGRCDAGQPDTAPPAQEALDADAAAQRLDDAFRGYLSERGAKPLPLAEMAGLVTGVTGVGLAADGVLDLWNGDSAEGDRAAARDELLASSQDVNDWYRQFAASLADGAQAPAPLPDDEGAGERLVAAVERDLRDADGAATATGVRVIWTGDHVDAVRRLQGTLVTPALDSVAS
ncbi:MAG TPA: FUSC family protein [Thermoleophilaceae bacterium]|nr:FUSC family protein [Thermoleophilaceae bacterium]